MSKALLLSVLLVVSTSSVAKSQDQITSRLTLSVTGVQSGIGYARSSNRFEELRSKSADAARRLAVRSYDDGQSSGVCSGRRWKCIAVGALIGGGVGVLIGNAYGDSPKYATEGSLIGPVRACIANCDGHVNNRRTFGIGGLVVGGGLVSFFTRNDQ